jgi:hypothetical protein
MYLHAVFKKPILNIKQVKNKRLKKDIPANVIHKKADLVILMFLFVCLFWVFFHFSFIIHMCMQGLVHFSPLPGYINVIRSRRQDKEYFQG